MLKLIFSDRRSWLLGLALALVVVVTRWVLTANQGFAVVVHAGYWVMLALVALFFRAVGPMLWARWQAGGLGRFQGGIAAGIGLTLVVWSAHEKPGYKILADELLLLGTSMGMHYEREAAYPTRATDVQGSFQILSSVMDKRPLLFPFLTATVHDLTGYRPENPFYLNMGLALVFLGLMYALGARLGRSPWAGALAVVLMAGLPLLAQQATGGGFELLNLVLIATFTLLLVRYLEQPGEMARLEALVLAALMLASTRYESAIFLVFAAGAVLAGWARLGRVNLSWPVMLSPLFLAPVLIQNRIFSANTKAWEMDSVAGVTEPFGWQYVAPNLGHALAFFFDFSGYQPSSALFAILGLLALPFFAFWVVKTLRVAKTAPPTELAWAIAGLGLLAVTAVYLLYFWGQFDQPLIRRLSLPLHFLMALAIVWLGARVFRSAAGWRGLVLVGLAGVFFQSLPVLAKQAYRTTYSPGVEMQIRDDFLARQPDPNLLFLDNDSFFWITHKIPASPIKQAQLRKEGIAYHLRNRSFQEIFVFQSIKVNDQTGERYVDPEDDLGPDFVLEPVWEQRVQTLLFARISRVTAIKERDQVIAEASRFIKPLEERRTVEQLNKNRAIYLENWIKKLP
jgi:hypothetical protein